MDMHELIKTRRSVRRYAEKPVEEEKLLQILEAGRWAPSASNMQPWEFIVITGRETRRKVADSATYFGYRWKHVEQCPVIIVIVGNPAHKWWTVDCSLAAQNMMLAAHALGLGTCFIGAFDEKKTKEVLGVPQEKRILGLMTLGYPEGVQRAPSRLPLENLVHRETYTRRERPPLSTKRGTISILLKWFQKKEL